jgi:hypothetical protein
MRSFSRKIEESRACFLEKVWPLVSKRCGGGRIMQVEGMPGAKELDCYAGIDLWQVQDNESHIRGIASRISNTRKLFETFTIRYSTEWGVAHTEFAKRVKAIEREWLYPALTIQACTKPTDTGAHGEVRWIGITRTKDLFSHIKSGVQGQDANKPADWYIQRIDPQGRYGSTDRKQFVVVLPEAMTKRGYRVDVVKTTRTA